MKYFQYLLFTSTVLISCAENKNTIDTSTIKVDFKLIDFHNLFFDSKNEEFEKLKQEHPFLFPYQVADSVWNNKRTNKEELLLYHMADSVFGDLAFEKKELTNLFKYFKYYLPNFKVPKTYAMISNLDYDSKVVFADSLLFISLDMYLGKNSEVYQSFPPYISEKYTKKHLVVDVAETISEQNFKIQRGNTFIENIIFQGKKLYLTQSLLPHYPKQEILGYSNDKNNWALQNEALVWSYFIENQLLYSTNKNLTNRFINPAPFSKFYMEFDRDSPGQIGSYIGMNIVSSFIEHNDISLLKLLALDAETIFRKSKYKPNK